tara:strand:- start:16844 stop:18034 length:1191 start_codon:yes stop_codon:yes gene_type:complete
MLRVIKIISFIFKVKKNFKAPSGHKILVFDKEASEDLKYSLKDKNFFLLISRPHQINEIYISFGVIINIIKFYRGNIVTAYFCALIKIINPNLIITMIDNSLKYFELTRIFKDKITFLAIQNAARYDIPINNFLLSKKKTKVNFSKKFYFDTLFCFGQHEVDHYKKNKININNFKDIGSLQLSNYLYHLKENKKKLPDKTFDFSLASEGHVGLDKEYSESGLAKRWSQIVSFSIKFAKSRNKKFNYIFKREKKLGRGFFENEIVFLNEFLEKEDLDFLFKNCTFKNQAIFSSYDAIAKSKVLLGCTSSLLREKLALGGKILSCNFSGLDMFDFPIKKLCFLKNPSYKDFSESLENLIKMSDKFFFKNIDEDANLLIKNVQITDANNEVKNFIKKFE